VGRPRKAEVRRRAVCIIRLGRGAGWWRSELGGAVNRVVRGLYVGAAVLAIVGLVLRVMPARVPRAERASGGTALAAPAPRGVASASAGAVADAGDDSIISANIFSRTRKAPPRPGEELPVAKAAPRVVKPAAPAWELLGTTIGPSGAVALIHSSGEAPGAELHRMGDVIAGARLVEITDSTVTLDRPAGGPLVLHLQSSQSLPSSQPHKKP
jgi:hypothetical protein